MKRSILIGLTYLDEKGNDFIVKSIEKGKPIYKSSGHKKGNSERIAISENGLRLKISKLKLKSELLNPSNK